MSKLEAKAEQANAKMSKNITIVNIKKNGDHPRFFWDAKIFLDDGSRFFEQIETRPLGYRGGEY